MHNEFPVSRSSSSCRCIWIFFLFLLLLLMPPPAASGREPHPETAHETSSVSAPLLVGWSWGTVFGPVQSALGNRRRMFQFATIGMCIGLYILMRK